MDKQERFEVAAKALAEARELNREEEMPILVEGKRDARAHSIRISRTHCIGESR